MNEASSVIVDKIKELDKQIETVKKELSEIKEAGFEIRGKNTLETFEIRLHKKHGELADLETAKKLQEILYDKEINKEAEELVKGHPKKNEG